MALVGRRVQAARAETSQGGQVKTVGGTKVVTGPNGNTAAKQTSAGVGKIESLSLHTDYELSSIRICLFLLTCIVLFHNSYIHSAHGANGAAAGKQTKVAVKTDNGVKTAQKTRVGAGTYREKKE